jgi:hypothetical protein
MRVAAEPFRRAAGLWENGSTVIDGTLIIHGDRDEHFAIAIPMAMYTPIQKSSLRN